MPDLSRRARDSGCEGEWGRTGTPSRFATASGVSSLRLVYTPSLTQPRVGLAVGASRGSRGLPRPLLGVSGPSASEPPDGAAAGCAGAVGEDKRRGCAPGRAAAYSRTSSFSRRGLAAYGLGLPWYLCAYLLIRSAHCQKAKRQTAARGPSRSGRLHC